MTSTKLVFIAKLFVTLIFVFAITLSSAAQTKAFEFNNRQIVMVTMKKGSEFPARVTHVKSKKQYIVQMLGRDKHELVHRKQIREITEAELAELKGRRVAQARY